MINLRISNPLLGGIWMWPELWIASALPRRQVMVIELKDAVLIIRNWKMINLSIRTLSVWKRRLNIELKIVSLRVTSRRLAADLVTPCTFTNKGFTIKSRLINLI